MAILLIYYYLLLLIYEYQLSSLGTCPQRAYLIGEEGGGWLICLHQGNKTTMESLSCVGTCLKVFSEGFMDIMW
jgi:hypothetical protein